MVVSRCGNAMDIIAVFVIVILFVRSSESRTVKNFLERFQVRRAAAAAAGSQLEGSSVLSWSVYPEIAPLGFRPEKSAEWPDPKTPPVWPTVFQAQFQEIVMQGPATLTNNNGTWFYDFDKKTARFDHNRGQKNVFCQGQGLSPKDPTADCQLLFTKSKDMWVIYPGAQSCCRLCGAAEGCTVLRPDWLKGSRLLETIPILGRACAGWAKRGAVAAADTWYQDQRGVPCRYHEVIPPFLHNITFVPASFSTAPIPSSVFQVPGFCQNKCPHPYFPPRAGVWKTQ